MTTEQEENLFEVIKALQKDIGPEIAIVVISKLKGGDINRYAVDVFEKLRLGRPKYKDGLLIAVAYDDHLVRIEVGYGLERIIKDEIARRIIREQMVPKFKEEKVYEGLYVAIENIKKLIEENKELVGQLL